MKKKITNTTMHPRHEWLMGGNSSAIVEQEKQGQNELCSSNQLPIAVNYPRGEKLAREYYQALGIEVMDISAGDKLFLDVKLPAGWSIQPTDHEMWSNLVDAELRIRATIFYKAAFYDRDAFINFYPRIQYKVDRLAFLNGDYSIANGEYNGYNYPIVGRITDYDGSILFETEHVECPVEYINDDNNSGYTKEYREKANKIETQLTGACKQYLAEHYPDYTNVLAYWDSK